uniref:GPI mannosyltransferase 1 n=2 Tax=Tetraselmis sp. GSL018 TaxID=582737 RepID=A0A061S429_9CHLO
MLLPQQTNRRIRNLFLGSGLLRVLLVFFGLWQDSFSDVKYTDIDYVVFSDAARFLAEGRSPFDRATYRYSPFLSVLLLPNVFCPIWGKLIFCFADVFVGWLVMSLNTKSPVSVSNAESIPWDFWCAVSWLLNPFTMTISTRGNGEAVVILMLLFQLWALRSGRTVAAGVIYGLAVHWRVYPAIYALSTALSLLGSAAPGRTLPSRLAPPAKFAAAAGAAFLGAASLWMCGRDFVEHAVLYHATRQDHRHNFSPFFYPVYLGWPRRTLLIKLAMVPQAAVNAAVALGFYKDLPFCWLLQTIAFVAFNKVCTAQYFVWYFGLLPLSLPRLRIKGNARLGAAAGAWLAAQLHWLGWAYLLEFQGMPVYAAVWFASCVFLGANAWLIVELMRAHSQQRGQPPPAKEGKES